MSSAAEPSPNHWSEPPVGTDPRPEEMDENFYEKIMRRQDIQMQRRMARRYAPESTAPEANEEEDMATNLVSARPIPDGWKGLTFTLLIELNGVVPIVSRRVTVPADITMDDLHKKVIVPVFGWVPNYHGYAFMRKPFDSRGVDEFGCQQLGFGFGPVDGRFMDMCHTSEHGIKMVDGTTVQLADIISSDHPELYYVYDLGDFFGHTVTLEPAEPVGDATPLDGDGSGAAMPKPKANENTKANVDVNELETQLLGGSGACPPENCGGNFRYAEMLDILDDSSHAEHRDTVTQCNRAPNYAQHNFRPYNFDVVAARRRLDAMWQVRRSKPRRTATSDSTCSCSLCRRRSAPPSVKSRAPAPSLFGGISPFNVPMISTGGAESDPVNRQTSNLMRGICEYRGRVDGVACCAFCMDRECVNGARFNRCGRCCKLFYCSKQCQKVDWKSRHKDHCKKADEVATPEM